MAGVADSDAAERLDALGDHVDQFELLAGVLVQEQVELVERRPAHQPVMFLVQRVQDLGIGESLIEALAGIHSRVGGQPDRELPYGAELLDHDALLVQPRLAGDCSGGPVGTGRACTGPSRALGGAGSTPRCGGGRTSGGSGRWNGGGTLGGQGNSSITAAAQLECSAGLATIFADDRSRGSGHAGSSRCSAE